MTRATATDAFSPGLLRMQEAAPAPLPRAVLMVVALLFALLLAWAVLGRVDIVASAEGRLVPRSFTQVVQPAEGGIVRDILVKEGQEVAVGQVLLRLDATTAQADLATLQSEAAWRRLTLRRIDAELAGAGAASAAPAGARAASATPAGAALTPVAGDAPELFAQVHAQYRARRQAYLDSLEQEKSTLERALHELQAARQTQAKLLATVPLYQQSAQSYERLVKEGFVSELGANDKLREKIEKEQELKSQDASVAALTSAVAQSQAKLAQIDSNYKSQLLGERLETQAQATRAEGELTKHRFKSRLLELRAPQGGIVKDLAATTPGAVVQPGAVLLTVVPKGEMLVAEVAVRNEDVGFVRAGQAARVKLAAFPFQKYGLVDAQVEHVGADATGAGVVPGAAAGDPRQPPAQQTYKAYVNLSRQALPVAGAQPLALAAGMAVVAEIHLGRRSVLEYLISPVQKVAHEAARER